MSDFFAMGGYAAYVWPSYAIAALVMAGLLVATLKGLRDAETTLKALEAVRPARRRERPARGRDSDDTAGNAAEASNR